MPAARTVLGSVTIQRQPAAEQAAAALREAILSGRILPGTPLREVAIATELGVSATPSARPRGSSAARA